MRGRARQQMAALPHPLLLHSPITTLRRRCAGHAQPAGCATRAAAPERRAGVAAIWVVSCALTRVDMTAAGIVCWAVCAGRGAGWGVW